MHDLRLRSLAPGLGGGGRLEAEGGQRTYRSTSRRFGKSDSPFTSTRLRAARRIPHRNNHLSWLGKFHRAVATVLVVRDFDQVAGHHGRESLIGAHVDVFAEEMHRAVGEQKIAAARMVAAEVIAGVRSAAIVRLAAG